RQIALGEDVSVRMNTQTSIALPSYGEGTNRVRLISGEAAFAIRSQNSLIVMAEEGYTVANQARFEVRNTGATVCVTCLDGNIRVQQGKEAADVHPGQQIRYDSAGLQQITAVDPNETAAWQDGVLIFRFTPLSEVVAEINRYRPGKVILMNEALGPNPVNGR